MGLAGISVCPWTHGRSPFDLSIHALEYRLGSATDDVTYHCASLSLGSIVPPDKSVDALHNIEAGQVIWCKALTLDTEVGIVSEEVP